MPRLAQIYFEQDFQELGQRLKDVFMPTEQLIARFYELEEKSVYMHLRRRSGILQCEVDEIRCIVCSVGFPKAARWRVEGWRPC